MRTGVSRATDDHELAVWVMLKVATGGLAEREANEVAMNPVGGAIFFEECHHRDAGAVAAERFKKGLRGAECV